MIASADGIVSHHSRMTLCLKLRQTRTRRRRVHSTLLRLLVLCFVLVFRKVTAFLYSSSIPFSGNCRLRHDDRVIRIGFVPPTYGRRFGAAVSYRSTSSTIIRTIKAVIDGSVEDNDNNIQNKTLEDLDEIFLDEHNIGIFQEGPEAFFDEDDLSMLHDISMIDENQQVDIPTHSLESSDSYQPFEFVSITDLNKISLNVSYFYLRNEVGLSEEIMWKITNEAGSALGMTAATIRKKIELLRSAIGLSDEELRSIIGKQPTLLHLSADDNLAPTIRFIRRYVHLKKDELKCIVIGCPSILANSIDTIRKKIQFFTRDMGYTTKDCKYILCKEPRLLRCGVETGLLPRLRFLEREMEFPLKDIRTICRKNPRILLKSLDKNLRPKIIFFFIMTLHMEPNEVLKMLLRFPFVLEYNLEEQLRPITRFLLSIDFSAHEISRMFIKFPRIVTHSLSKIKHVVGYLRYELGLEASDVRRVLYQAPQALGLTTSNLKSKVEFLDSVSCNGTTASLRKLIVGMPTALCLSVESNLRPKVDYLTNRLGGGEGGELCKALDRLPCLLGYSLDKRIRPRLEAILEEGLDGGILTVGIPMKQDNFEKWLQGRVKANKQKSSLTTNEVSILDYRKEDSRTIAEEGGRVVHWKRD